MRDSKANQGFRQVWKRDVAVKKQAARGHHWTFVERKRRRVVTYPNLTLVLGDTNL